MPDSSAGSALPWSDLEAYRAEYRARCPVPLPEVVVEDLAGLRQWLMWRYEPNEDPAKKPRKVPYYASGKRRLGKQGSDADRAALADYATVADAARDGFDGVGFAFLPGDGLIGIDLDGMIDPATNDFNDRCQAIIDACNTYTELSPSGKGVHIIGRGSVEKSFKSDKVGVEVFCGSQFFTFTGACLPLLGGEVAEIPLRTLARLKATVDEAKKKASPAAPVAEAPTRQPGSRSVAEEVALVEEALRHIDAGDYHLWIKIGMACHSLGTAGFMAWDAWSATCGDKYDPAATRKRWDTFKAAGASLGSIYEIARENGWEAPWDKAKKKRRAPPAETASPPNKAGAGASGDKGAPPDGGSPPPEPPDDDDWELGLIRKKGDITSCLANAELILANVEAWRGIIGYDEFAECTSFRQALPFARSGSESGVWSDHLDTMTTIWLQRAFRVEFAPMTVGKAIEACAQGNRFHPVREALAALPKWDGVRRLDSWLVKYLGVRPDVEVGDEPPLGSLDHSRWQERKKEHARQLEYFARVGTYFVRGMIQRVMRPGCKFDYCLVLEGLQGKGKSSVARILSWHWFADTDLDLSNKDSLLALPGHWVYEIAELGSLMRAEERKQKSFLSRQEDEYRKPYGTRMEKVPRQNVFIGTTNEEEYLKDATGARRFWPARVTDIDHAGLEAVRELLYAEALADFHAGEKAYPTREEEETLFKPEQQKRGMPEPFEDILHDWVRKQTAPFTMAEAAMAGLNLSTDKLTPAVVTRLGITLKKLGCGRVEQRLAADPGQRRLYTPPKSRDDDDGTGSAMGGDGYAQF